MPKVQTLDHDDITLIRRALASRDALRAIMGVRLPPV